MMYIINTCIMYRSPTPANQGEPGLRDRPGPLEMSSVDGTGCTLDIGLQKEGGLVHVLV